MPASARATLTAAVRPTAPSPERTCRVTHPARKSYVSASRSASSWVSTRLTPSSSMTLARTSTSGGRSSTVTNTNRPGRCRGVIVMSNVVRSVSPPIDPSGELGGSGVVDVPTRPLGAAWGGGRCSARVAACDRTRDGRGLALTRGDEPDLASPLQGAHRERDPLGRRLGGVPHGDGDPLGIDLGASGEERGAVAVGADAEHEHVEPGSVMLGRRLELGGVRRGGVLHARGAVVGSDG